MDTKVLMGHESRGEEIFELLQMLGGKNTAGLKNTFTGFYYWINEDNEITVSDMLPSNATVYSLEDFKKEYPFKVGDLVRYFPHKVSVIKSMFISYDGDIKYRLEEVDDEFFQAHQLEYVGQAEYYQVNENIKSSKDVNLQQLEKQLDEALEKETKESLEEFFFGDPEPQPKAPILSNRYDYADGKCGYVIPDGYEFDCIKNGFQNEIILKPKKPKYPTTYRECCVILKLSWDESFGFIHYNESLTKDENNLVETFIKLKRCRDVYWKIAGEEMGLDKPWKPDWKDSSQQKYTIFYYQDEITSSKGPNVNRFLSFPTEEMRDAFLENFENLIEECKELL